MQEAITKQIKEKREGCGEEFTSTTITIISDS